MVGFGFHLIYMCVLIMYVNLVYIENTANMKPSNLGKDHGHDGEWGVDETRGYKLQRVYTIILACSILYPCLYEITQLKNLKSK